MENTSAFREKPLVLIVEDNHINALILKKSLAKEFDCVLAKNDKQAFEALDQHVIKLILMDINLGSQSLDGEAIMKILRKDPKYPELKIFAVTSYAMPEDKIRFLNAGFDAYFPKPIEKKVILQAVRAEFQMAS